MTTSDRLFEKLPEGENVVPGGRLTNQITDAVQKLLNIGGGSTNILSNGAGKFIGKRSVDDNFWEGVLTQELAVATNYLTGKSHATANRILNGENGNLSQTDVEITVVNHNPYESGEVGDYVAGHIIDDVFRVLWIYSAEAIASIGSYGSVGSGTGVVPIGSDCIFSIGGIDFMEDLAVIQNPRYVLGLDEEGCLIKVPVSDCPTGS